MAKPTDHKIESADTVIGEIAVPDKASLGWSPAEHVVVHLGGQETVQGFSAPITGPDEEASIIEFAAMDVPAGSLLVDLDGYDPDTLDLNELLSETEIALEDPQDAGLPDIAQMSVDLAFPPLTVVIDDESGTDSVAL